MYEYRVAFWDTDIESVRGLHSVSILPLKVIENPHTAASSVRHSLHDGSAAGTLMIDEDVVMLLIYRGKGVVQGSSK